MTRQWFALSRRHSYLSARRTMKRDDSSLHSAVHRRRPAFVACSNHRPATDLIVYEASDGSATNVYTMNPSGTERRQLTFNKSFDGNPAWSPDHKQIVFSSDRGGPKNDLYVMDAGGGAVRRATDTPDASEFSPKFSP